jgi:hypothetical protein
MATTAEDRAKAIQVIKERLLAVTQGHTNEEAEQVATGLVDQAIRDRETGGHDAGS